MKSARLDTVDALRGIACLMVAVFHIRGALGDDLQSWLPTGIYWGFSKGYIGVAIFFVVSGFVIAYTVSQFQVSAPFVARFAARRSLRLDPPYWVAIVLEIILIYIALTLFPQQTAPMPSVPQVVAHVFYLQDFLGYGNIAAVFWTLCIEFQFYLFFVVCLAVAAKLKKPLVPALGQFGGIGFFALYGFSAGCILFTSGLLKVPINGTFLPYWPYFFLGVLVAWTYRSGLDKRYFFAFLVLTAASGIFDMSGYLVAAVSTSVLLYWVSVKNLFSRVLVWGPLIYLGKISYSLYLFHSIVGWRVVTLAKKLHPEGFSIIESAVLFFSALLVSVIAAHIAFILLEYPAIRMGRKISYRQAGTLPG